MASWNNGNTWIRQEPSTPSDSLDAYIGLPETGVAESLSHTEQQQPAATHTACDTSIAADPPTSQHLIHSKPQQQPQDLHEGVPNKRKQNEKAPYRLDSIPEPTLEQQATLHIGNDGSPGPASKGAAVKSDDWTTPTNRPRGDTKISPLTTQRRLGKPQHPQERVDTLTDTTMPLSPIANHSAAHRFALNPKVGSACITITEYDVLGRQLMNGQGDRLLVETPGR